MRKDDWYKICGIAAGMCVMLAAAMSAAASAAEGADQAVAPETSAPGTSAPAQAGPVSLDPAWQYAENSVIHTGQAQLIVPDDPAKDRGITVCVNAGHGTQGGDSQKTLSHPDGTPKVTGGTTAAGEIWSTAVSTGTEFLDGTWEASANLSVALALKDLLLEDGYRVLMIRSEDDVQFDNIARTVIANNCADCHVAIHFDSTDSDKGAFYVAVPADPSYRAMEPVASHWQEHERLGQSLIAGISGQGLKLFSENVPMDLTQTSYSTVPSVDIEVGDRASDHSPEACARIAQGLKAGIDLFFSAE